MISLAFLVLSISLLASNSTTIRFNDITATYHYNDVYAYRYALATAVIGLSYTFLHLLSSFEQMRTGKVLLANDPRILLSDGGGCCIWCDGRPEGGDGSNRGCVCNISR
ncbi:hypothetical protein C2S51_005362 [Perilla frutescens var. frutescens]|nr:hypothetical protein C2S51_005362 [Perilla frutescens var. frutescens]